MIPKDLYAKVRRIEFKTSRLVCDIFAGEYKSVFKGQGMEFDEVREYNLGDDVRSIDWNVTARMGKAYVKKFVEERELTVMILVDVSASCRFASTNILKSQLAAEIVALLALAATRNQDKVGLIIFTDKIEKFIPPRKGLQHVLRLIREILYFKPQGQGTNLIFALEYLSKVTHRRTISFLISDFFESRNRDGKIISPEAIKRNLAVANKRHDLIAITLNDPREKELVPAGMISFADAETGEVVCIDSSQKQLREQYAQNNFRRLENRKSLFRLVGMDHIDVATDHPYTEEIVRFFLRRKTRR